MNIESSSDRRSTILWRTLVNVRWDAYDEGAHQDVYYSQGSALLSDLWPPPFVRCENRF